LERCASVYDGCGRTTFAQIRLAPALHMFSTLTAPRAGRFCRAPKRAGGELQFAQNYVRDFMLTTLPADHDPRYKITSPSPHVVRISDGCLSRGRDTSYLIPPAQIPTSGTTA
jgi:hypothetical protein